MKPQPRSHRPKARVPYRRLRLLLLLLGIAMVGTIGVMLAAHRFASRSQPPKLAETTTVSDLDDEDLYQGEGLEYRIGFEGKPSYIIRAESIREDRAETAHLTDVSLELFRDNGEVVKVRSNEAAHNHRNKDTKLEGDVFVDGVGIELETRTLLVGREGQSLVSTTPVALRYPPNLAGRASNLKVNLDQEHYILDGGVHLHSTPASPFPFKLDATKLIHERATHVIRALGKVHLERGTDVIEADSLVVTFDEAMRNIRSVRARHDVIATVFADSGLGADRMRVTGDGLVVRFDPPTGAARRIEVEGEIAVLERNGADLIVQRFIGTEITADLAGGNLRTVDGVGAPVTLTESLDMPDEPYLLKQACSDHLVMHFATGGAAHQLRLEGQVELADRDVYISGGNQAQIDFKTEIMRLSGTPVSLYHEDGQVTAPGFVYHGNDRRIEGAGGVSAVLDDRAGRLLRATPLGSGEGPVQVESESATWTLAPAKFLFEDNVRAWRGPNIIFANQLRGEETEQRIAASGDVSTSWVPRSFETEDGGPIEVSADQMVYDRLRNQLVYTDNVDALQADRTMRCNELVVELASGSSTARRMRCQGDVTLDDPTLGRKVEGDTAIYAFVDDLIEVTGDPVTVHETGSTLTCRYFSYDIETGAVEVRSTPPGAAAPAIAAPNAAAPNAGPAPETAEGLNRTHRP